MHNSGSAFRARQTSKPRHVGHVQVEEDQVRPLAPGGLQAGDPSFRADDLQALLHQSNLGDLQSVAVVVDDQNLHAEVLPARACRPITDLNGLALKAATASSAAPAAALSPALAASSSSLQASVSDG